MSKVSTIVNIVMKKYIEEEEMVKNLIKKNDIISFSVDVIDEDVLVSISIINEKEGVFGLKYKSTHKKVVTQDFKKFLSLLMEGFLKDRNNKIEFYTRQDDEDKDDMQIDDDEDYDENEDNEDIEIEVDNKDDWKVDGEEDLENILLLRETIYDILKPDELLKMHNQSVDRVSEAMYIPKSRAKIILRSYNWNVEKLMNTFTKYGSKDKLLEDLGLSTDEVDNKMNIDTNLETKFNCLVCLDECDYYNTTKLKKCNENHRFCNNCWRNHLQVKIKDGYSKRIFCMFEKCHSIVDDDIVHKLISNKKIRQKYDKKILDSFVEDNTHVKWCPGTPFCGNCTLCKVHNECPIEVHCECGFIWCFNCIQEPHLPASCDMMVLWRKKCKDDSETLNWIHSNTRDCPGCCNYFKN